MMKIKLDPQPVNAVEYSIEIDLDNQTRTVLFFDADGNTVFSEVLELDDYHVSVVYMNGWYYIVEKWEDYGY